MNGKFNYNCFGHARGMATSRESSPNDLDFAKEAGAAEISGQVLRLVLGGNPRKVCEQLTALFQCIIRRDLRGCGPSCQSW